MFKWCLVFVLACTSVFGRELLLKEKLGQADPGDYLVTEQSKNYIFINIFEREGESIVLEEVSIPCARFQRLQMGWREWFECGGPGHTSWTLSQINFMTGSFEEVFSFTQQGWIDMSQADSFLTTLLNLPFQEIPEEYRKRVGSVPGPGKPDHRPIWNPRLTASGRPIRGAQFTAWKARWPNDGSELARKTVEIYLPDPPQNPNLPPYPTFFPYWVEVEGKTGSARLRVIDSGINARSPRPCLPRRSSQFIGNTLPRRQALAVVNISYAHSPHLQVARCE